jgi:hypothetical protein
MAKTIPPKAKLSDKIMGGLFPEEQPTTASPLPCRKVKEAQKERLQMTIQPSMKIALQQYADDNDTSMNKLVLQILGDFLKRENYL